MSDKQAMDRPGSGWRIACAHYDPDQERQRETVFALGNGVFVTRAASADAVAGPHHYPGTYRAGCYALIESELAGARTVTEALVNLPNWLPLTFSIEGGPWFSIDRCTVLEYEHCLDLQHGCTRRSLVFRDEQGRHTRISEERFVSMADPRLGVLRFALTPLGWSGKVFFRCLLDGRVSNANVARYAGYRQPHVAVRASHPRVGMAALTVHLQHGGIEIAQASHIACDAPLHRIVCRSEGEGRIVQNVEAQAEAGRTIAVDKLAALCSTQDPEPEPPLARAAAALDRSTSVDALRTEHEHAWAGLWQRVALDVQRPELARPLRLHAFHILQTFSPHTPALDVGLPARGWHGEGYHGHVFWDELFVLPFLNLRFPELARAALQYRYRRLDAARAAAQAAGFRGAMYPWRSAGSGREVTPNHQQNMLTGDWMPDHTHLQRHIGAAIAFNVWQYFLATGDTAFLAESGAEMMLEIARFWAGIAQPVDGERYAITGVIGPDEYHSGYPWRSEPGVDNNAYTNLMAAWTLQHAPAVLRHLPPDRCEQLLRRLDIDESEFAFWERIGRRMKVPFHDDGILSQFDGYERLPEFDRAVLPPEYAGRRPDWALNAIGGSANDWRLAKQADALMLFYLLPPQEASALLASNGYAFDRAALKRSADYYLVRTAHRSSLSRIVYAGALAEVDPARSWALYLQTLGTDLQGLAKTSTVEGIHLGAMGGTLDILQRRYLGLRPALDGLHVEPTLPPELGRVRMGICFRGMRLDVEAEGADVRVCAAAGNPASVPLVCHGEMLLLKPGDAVRVAGA